ncbi:MAG: transposase [Desulfobacteraceae bacterium]|nr:transposase [Desulfobacteraceae bacterium]
MKLLDGNCIEKTHHRIKELRDLAAGPLPGKSLVVYDPCLRLPIDVFPCEDGHAQERSLLNQVLLTIEKKDAWIADRIFCTVEFTCGIDSKDAFCVIREHKKYPWTARGEEILAGETETGTVYEQAISVTDLKGNDHKFRRIRIQLKGETRDGDKEICLISNLPSEDVTAEKIAEVYKGRWTIETAFQYLTDYLESEINTLGYPKAALFGFCVALVS